MEDIRLIAASNITLRLGKKALFEEVNIKFTEGNCYGLIGANGEGKSTFMNIITGKLMPDEGKIEWAKNVRVGYLDQHTLSRPQVYPLLLYCCRKFLNRQSQRK